MLLLTFGLTQAIFCQKTTEQKLDDLMNAYVSLNKFNGSVLVAQKGKIVLEKGYGLKNVQNKTMNDANSIFQTYSITKTFTSTVTLKLIEQGKLSLSDKLSQFYPQFPKGDSITIEHLLTHTSGIYDYTRGGNMPDQTEKSFLALVESKPLDFSPGTGWSYSNSGYWLLGFIIQKITGISYEDAVRKYIFKPLHMDHSGFAFKNLAGKDKTTGYALFTEQVKTEAIIYEPPGPYAAGAIYSTVGDLYKYHKGLQTFKIISEASLKKAYRPFKNGYGYGWMNRSYEGHEVVSHSGGAAGYRSNFVRIPKEDICIILLNNHERANVELITKNIINILINKTYIFPAEIKLPSAVLERYTGAFSLKPSFTFYITIEDGRLAVQPSMQPKTILLAQKENSFYAEEVNSFIDFIKDEQGNYNEAVLRGDQNASCKRIYPTWGLTGTATTKEWNDSIPDIQFTQDPLRKSLWTLNNITLKTGLVVFRLNNDWGYHYGDNGNDKMLDMFGEDIKVEAGIYDIILDFTDETKPRYTILKK
jgi:CubicO group peptidase (beta-lactamase class C family)